MMEEACQCGRDSSATCRECHRRVCDSYYALTEGERSEYGSASTFADPPEPPAPQAVLRFDVMRAAHLCCEPRGAVCFQCRTNHQLRNYRRRMVPEPSRLSPWPADSDAAAALSLHVIPSRFSQLRRCIFGEKFADLREVKVVELAHSEDSALSQ